MQERSFKMKQIK